MGLILLMMRGWSKQLRSWWRAGKQLFMGFRPNILTRKERIEQSSLLLSMKQAVGCNHGKRKDKMQIEEVVHAAVKKAVEDIVEKTKLRCEIVGQEVHIILTIPDVSTEKPSRPGDGIQVEVNSELSAVAQGIEKELMGET